ncbi:MAG: GDP-mannose 4,6-dehydratase [bacterium]|nr:GDP-mannose 4,6-dehydratase [bacterium]
MKILLTGGAGFIGSAVGRTLLIRGDQIVIVDNFNNYYDPTLKEARVRHFLSEFKPVIVRADIADRDVMGRIFSEYRFDRVCHLAAQAGVRYSLENPFVYAQSNVVGTLTLLELARLNGNVPFIYASSSSVYGANDKLPFSEDDRVDQPLSLYAATKRSTELLAHAYHSIYGLPSTGLRFFTVYGPWGRPDMAMFIFIQKMLASRPLTLFNHGRMARDFTYIDDIVAGVVAAIDRPFPYEIINLGNNRPVALTDLVAMLEHALGIKAKIELTGMQPGDVRLTFADIAKAQRLLDWQPRTDARDGVLAFVSWYRKFYGV